METNIRMATKDDAYDILNIYAPYITDTCVTFEIEVPSFTDFENRIENIMNQYPFLVYEQDGIIAGYAYASKHAERAAYLYSVDVSIYIRHEYQGEGIGKKLYTALFEQLVNQGYYTAYAGISMPNEKSVRLHEAFGFVHAGTFHNIGYKHGKWLDVMWLEKPLREYT